MIVIFEITTPKKTCKKLHRILTSHLSRMLMKRLALLYRPKELESAKLRALRAHVPCVPRCQRALRAYALTCQRALRTYALTYQRVLRAYVLTCQCVLRA